MCMSLPGDISLLISFLEVPPMEGAEFFLKSAKQALSLPRPALSMPGNGFQFGWATCSGILSSRGGGGWGSCRPPLQQLKCCLGGTHSHHSVPKPSERGLLPGHLLSLCPPEGRPDYGGQIWAPSCTQVRGSLGANPGYNLSKVLTWAVKWEPTSWAWRTMK